MDPNQRYYYQDIHYRLKEAQQCKITDSTNLLLQMPQHINSQSKIQGNPYKSPVETQRLMNISLYPEQLFINSQLIPGNNSLPNYGNSLQSNNEQFIQTSKQQQLEQPQTIIQNQQSSPYNSRIKQDKISFVEDIRDAFLNINEFPGIFNNWVKYEGDFYLNKKHRIGSIIFSNGDFYIGGFQIDNMEGRGTYTQKYGQTYIGFWEGNKLIY